MKTTFVVLAAVLNAEGKLLLLQKADDDYSFPQKWGLCAGHIKEFEPAEEGILREIKEETGLDATIQNVLPVVEVHNEEKTKGWIAKPFVCKVESSSVTLCHENKAFAWVEFTELDSYDLVPWVKKDLKHMGLIS